jgi:hypothetical protein
MRWLARVAAAGAAAVALAGCLEAPPESDGGDDGATGDAGPKPDAGDVAAACVSPPGDACGPLAEGFRDSFENLDAWFGLESPDCTYTPSAEAGVGITRNAASTYCTLQTVTGLDLRCSSAYVHFDASASAMVDAAFSIILADGTYYYIERQPPQLLAGLCTEDCLDRAALTFSEPDHLHFRIRSTGEELVLEVGGQDEGLVWSKLVSFDDVPLEALACVTLELGNYQEGTEGVPATFFELNL